MRILHLFVFAIACTLMFNSVSAKYTEWLRVQVFDQNFRTVEGAQVYAQHQLNAVAGLVKTKPKTTNVTGEVSINFTDYEEIINSTDYAYTLYVKYGNHTGTGGLIAGNNTKAKPRVYSFTIEAYYLAIRATDHNRHPLNGTITVTSRTISNFTKTADTDSQGNVFVHLPSGDYDVKIETPSFTKVEFVSVSKATGDRNVDFVIGLYPMDMLVVDDNRTPLQATVEVLGKTVSTDAEGMAHFENVTETSPAVNVRYGKTLKKIKPQLDRQASVEVVFDIHKPEIKELYATVSKGGVGTITLFAEDDGKSASGIQSVSVIYDVDGVQSMLQTYTIGYNSFETKVPAQLPSSLVKYTVTVTDKDGNSASGTGVYTVPPAEASPDEVYIPTNTSIPMEGIVVGIVAFAIAVYGVVYYFNKKKEEEEAEAESPYKNAPPSIPPVAPPSIPKK